jgi:hypothetical protein
LFHRDDSDRAPRLPTYNVISAASSSGIASIAIISTSILRSASSGSPSPSHCCRAMSVSSSASATMLIAPKCVCESMRSSRRTSPGIVVVNSSLFLSHNFLLRARQPFPGLTLVLAAARSTHIVRAAAGPLFCSVNSLIR